MLSNVSADTFDDTVVADKQADETRMDTWRSEVKIAEEENAQTEADYRAKVAEARGVTEKAERDAKGESEHVKQENEKRKAAYKKKSVKLMNVIGRNVLNTMMIIVTMPSSRTAELLSQRFQLMNHFQNLNFLRTQQMWIQQQVLISLAR